MRLAWVLALAVTVPLGFSACASGGDKPMECKGCAMAKADNGWCPSCNVGFKDGEKVKCKSCHAAATGKGGWCDSCNKGYVNGKPAACKGCAMAAATGGTCPTCNK